MGAQCVPFYVVHFCVLYGSSCPRQPACALPWISTFDEKKWYMTFPCDERITEYMLFNTIANSLELLTDSFSTISAHPNNHFCRYRMSLMQILHKNIIIEINETHWEIKLIFFLEHIKCWLSLLSVLLICWFFFFYFFYFFLYGSEDM